jgi:hypothetical protein
MNAVIVEGTKFYLKANLRGEKQLCIEGEKNGFEGQEKNDILVCQLNRHNAAALRCRIPWLNPQPLGLVSSFGFGDRLGLATPGHIAAVRNSGIAPIFAQQSVRENERTGRNPQVVLDDAMWSVFEMGWCEPWGADADHVKEIADLDSFISAGYSFYTIDPNIYVDDDAHTDTIQTLSKKIKILPWRNLETTQSALSQKYLSKPISLGEEVVLKFSEKELFRALVKYGHALAHVKSLSDHLGRRMPAYDLEVSVDETDTPTTVKEHYFIASELRRLNVPFVSLAPRFIGRFEKGVDYIGNLQKFEREFENHGKVMRAIGGYKISIHTGSDKFSIYPIIAKHTKNYVHVKTAGTSYLEALRVIAKVDISLFSDIYKYALKQYENDRVSYHVSGVLEKTPDPDRITLSDLSVIIDQFDSRQVLHVTFGSVLDEFCENINKIIRENSCTYKEFLRKHFERHLKAFRKQ